MQNTPETAMILAAGLGKRMLPITEQMPKPMVRVSGKPLIDHNLDRLVEAHVSKCVINVHYLADQIISHVRQKSDPQIIVSDETDLLLDSGGGVKKALEHLGNEPFFLMNSDSFWLEGAHPNLQRLADTYCPNRMDILLLLSDMANAYGYEGSGDFNIDPDGRLSRREEKQVSPFVYCGAAIMHPRVFQNTPDGPFSLNMLFDRAIEAGTMHGVRMEGIWLHVGTPAAIPAAEEAIARSAS